MPKMTYHDRNAREIALLQPGLRPLLHYMMFHLGRLGEDVLIVQSFRTKEEQEEAFEKEATQVHWPYSFHNHGAAVDVVPVLFGQTKIIWNATERYQRIASAFMQWGFEWGGTWAGSIDKPHMQFTQGKTIYDFTNGYQINKGEFEHRIKTALDTEERNLLRAKKFASEKRKKLIDQELKYLAEVRTGLYA
jgi:peptidoglycan L-alanyl-D-glutamate endopeptidase CwlK